ncbi:hypothetical protein MTO96_025980 [Rhipicephalus appendiculatus]
MMTHHVLSHCQKVFLPYDGVFELNYILQHRTNAYGSVPHGALLDALRGAGAGAVFTELIADLYRGNQTIIAAAEGTTEPVAIAAGLRQGCPLSGLLFNLVVDPVIRGVQGDGDAHNILAYADDLTPLADSPAQLQDRINLVEALASPPWPGPQPGEVLVAAYVRRHTRRDETNHLYGLRRSHTAAPR